jgi:hypothetical protein
LSDGGPRRPPISASLPAADGGIIAAMTRRDSFTLGAILAALALMFYVTHLRRPERVRPGTPEYEAYIQHYVEECLKNPTRYEVLLSLPPAELEAACRDAVLRADRFNPSARPLRG